MADVTFRDFAAAAMRGDTAAAATVLETLLGLDAAAATAAATHFAGRMASGGPAFLQQAMGLRTAVASGTEAEIAAILGDCFGLTEPALGTAVATVRSR